MKFGGKIIKQTRSAFNRQISESVQIQINAEKHFILNSKSEYNRCALPRLATKLGEIPMDKLEKQIKQKKIEEKEREKELVRKIRELRVRQSYGRREKVSNLDQPAEKRRRTGQTTHKRVYQDNRKQNKRPETERKEEEEEQNTGYYPIFKKKRIEQQDTEEDRSSKEREEQKNETEQDRKLQEEEEEKARRDRKEKALRLQKSWELLRQCKAILEENGEKWKKSKERRDQERRKEEEREERKARAKRKEEGWEAARIQKKITETLLLIPENRAEMIRREEERERRLLLKESKEEIWKRWRQVKGRKGRVEGDRNSFRYNEMNSKRLESKLKKIEEEVQRYNEEKKKRIEENRQREEERNTRLLRKKEREKHWEMIRWITQFIEENRQHWKERDENRKREEEEEEKKRQEPGIMRKERKPVKDPEEKKKERLRQAKMMKEYWKNWRKNSIEEYEEEENEPAEEETEEEKEGSNNREEDQNQLQEEEERELDTGEERKSNLEEEEKAREENEENTEKEKDEEESWQQISELAEYGSGKKGGRLCLTCLLHPCICVIRRLERRLIEMNRKEENKPGRKRTRSGTKNKNLFPSVIEDEDLNNPPPPQMPAAKKPRVGHHKIQAGIKIEKLRPQPQPLVHQGGAGAKEGDQPPHHQHLGDGREVGRNKDDEINKKCEDGNSKEEILVDQHPHQTPIHVGVGDVVRKITKSKVFTNNMKGPAKLELNNKVTNIDRKTENLTDVLKTAKANLKSVRSSVNEMSNDDRNIPPKVKSYTDEENRRKLVHNICTKTSKETKTTELSPPPPPNCTSTPTPTSSSVQTATTPETNQPKVQSETKTKLVTKKQNQGNLITQFIQKLNTQETKPPPLPNTQHLPKVTPTPKVIKPKPVITSRTEGGGSEESMETKPAINQWKKLMEKEKPEKIINKRTKLPTVKPSSNSKPSVSKTIKRKGVLKPGEQLNGQLTLTKYLELKKTAQNTTDSDTSCEGQNTLDDRAADIMSDTRENYDDRGGKTNGTIRNTAAD